MDTQYDLTQIAEQVMAVHGLEPNFSDQIFDQLHNIHEINFPQKTEDLRDLPWCSIDNDDSLDLDQLTYAEEGIIWVAIADVDSLVSKNSPIDAHAQKNTTSVYTPSIVFHMLPEKLSTNLTSLNENENRTAMVAKVHLNPKGEIIDFSIFQALVRNQAKLTYNSVGPWLEGKGPIPEKVERNPALEKVLKLQHEIAQRRKRYRHSVGALTLQSPEMSVKVIDNKEIVFQPPIHNAAHELIEEFMIAANYSFATSFKNANLACLRRVVEIPKRWDRIVDVAASYGEFLPKEPDSLALEGFLVKMKKAEPESFQDLSLTIIKLLGRGIYIVEHPDSKPKGHFALALPKYGHATAPNRRFPDLIAQRQYKALLEGRKAPYSLGELQILAERCTQQEDEAKKVERHLNKSAAALLLKDQIGKKYKGIITGAGEKGTWVRIFQPPIEGKVVKGFQNLDVGDHVTVELVHVDIPRGYIDFRN